MFKLSFICSLLLQMALALFHCVQVSFLLCPSVWCYPPPQQLIILFIFEGRKRQGGHGQSNKQNILETS